MGIAGDQLGTATQLAAVPDGWRDSLARALLVPALDSREWSIGQPGVSRDTALRLADEAARYVLTGEPADAPSRLGAPSVMFGSGFTHDPTARRDLVDGLVEVPAAVGLRWARVLVRLTPHHWRGLPLPAADRWLDVLLVEATRWRDRRDPTRLTMAALERLQSEAGLHPGTLLVALLRSDGELDEYGVYPDICGLPDTPEAIDRHAEALLQHFPSSLPPRGWALTLLERAHDSTLPRFAEQLTGPAVRGSRQQREAASALLVRAGTGAAPALRTVALGGAPPERAAALQLLHTIAAGVPDAELAGWVEQAAAADRAESVRRIAARWAEPAPGETVRPYRYPVPRIEWAVQLDDEARGRIRSLWRSLQEDSPRQPTLPDLDAVLRYLGSDAVALPPELAAERPGRPSAWQLKRQLGVGTLPPPGLVKLLQAIGWTGLEQDGSPALELLQELHEQTGRPALLELAELLRPLGDGGAAVLQDYCSSGRALARDWPDAEVWPFFAQHLAALEEILARRAPRGWDFDPDAPYRALRTLPWLQPSTVEVLFATALGTQRPDRPRAQTLLATLPGTPERVLPALGDRSAEVRAAAAGWLGRLGHQPAVPELERVFRTDPQDAVRVCALDALEALGRPVEEYLDRGELAAAAERGLARGLPAALAWFPWAQLPAVRWHDGEPVPAAVLRWFLVQAARAKTPVPNALLRRYGAQFDPRDREAFGQFVLQAWLAEDLRPISPEQARQEADESAPWQQHRYPGKTVAEVAALILPQLLHKPAGSAVDSKGVLAVAAACAAERAAAAAGPYLTTWYGTRLAQSKALVTMLAWVEHRSATQLMLSLGSRFRTRAIQDEARRQAEALAERHGWTAEELADRTAPTAGFDERGEQFLDYGPRGFTAVLGPGPAVTLRDSSGATVPALPAPRRSDDPDLAAAAKAALAASRRELKAVVAGQTQRLYEAMCAGRGWTAQDWHDVLLQHPVLGRLVQRLVWVAEPPGRAAPRVVFRPLDGGPLAGLDGGQVVLPAGSLVRLAHRSTVPAEAAARWPGHLREAGVIPLFDQFGRSGRPVPQPLGGDRITDVEGHLIESFRLRRSATKLGYSRGPVGDGAAFETYTKDFPSLALQARIHFTGSTVPEQNRSTALKALDFVALRPGADDRRPARPLGGIPQILLAECYHDLWLIAQDGTGHDPDWRRATAR